MDGVCNRPKYLDLLYGTREHMTHTGNEAGRTALKKRIAFNNQVRTEYPYVWNLNALPLSLAVAFLALSVILGQ